MTPRVFLSAAIAMAGWATTSLANDAELAAVKAEIPRLHERSIARLREWIAHPAIAAENRGFPDGPERMAAMLRDAGFQHTEIIPTDGKPGVFATLDAGAPKTVGVYFMYDVKQFDPKEWTSPPLEGALVDKPGYGQVIVGRGAANQKGPEMAFLTALEAFLAAGKKLPVNLVLVAEGEEEIASPHIRQIVHRPQVQAALAGTIGVFMPMGLQNLDGGVTVNLGAKGVIEVELTSSGAAWGRGPMRDVHSSFKSMVDSPTWHLIAALNSLVTPDGNTVAIDGWFDNVRPLLPEEKAMIADAAKKVTERTFQVGAATRSGSTTCRSSPRSSATSRSRRPTSRASTAATPAPAARPCCRTRRP